MIGAYVEVASGPRGGLWGYVLEESGCWTWAGRLNYQGYAHFHDPSRPRRKSCVRAHRYMYERVHGPIPAGMTLDHQCRNRACVNPSHLVPMPIRANTLLGSGPTALNARKTWCIHGHSNWVVLKSGHRRCITCHNIRSHDRYRRLQAKRKDT